MSRFLSVGISFVTESDRPDLVSGMWAVPNPWPTFVLQDVVSDFGYDQLPVRYPEYQLIAVDGDQVWPRVNAVPYAWSGLDEDLPDTGWDFALGMAFRPETPAAATAVCLIEARIHPDMAGTGLGTDLPTWSPTLRSPTASLRPLAPRISASAAGWWGSVTPR
jgi:hypothetical protein